MDFYIADLYLTLLSDHKDNFNKYNIKIVTDYSLNSKLICTYLNFKLFPCTSSIYACHVLILVVYTGIWIGFKSVFCFQFRIVLIFLGILILSLSLQVSGLSKLKSSSRHQSAKVQTLGPARASGLRKRLVGCGRKTSPNNENKPGVQATISSLWKNFSFKK